MNKSLLFIVDLEGCAGVYDNSAESIELMNEQVDYILSFMEANTSHKLSVLDFHDAGVNLTSTISKHPQVDFIKHIWNFNDTIHYDAAFLIGFHARRGVDGGLSHTFRNDIKGILLGNNEVGEAEIVCNWLQGLKIQVLLINGDEYFCKSTNLGIRQVVLPKNGIDRNDEFRKKYYEQLCVAIYKSLNEAVPKGNYIKDAVYVELCYSYQTLYFPSCYYKIQGSRIIFRDTMQFISRLQELCVILNSSINITSARLERLVKFIRFHYTKEEISLIKDERFLKIINDMDSWNIEISDENYILNKLSELGKGVDIAILYP